ncbi:MAG TPA: preprotein translocase subunit YajC [Longimicrobiales bacterium]|nr:preprotein translocase subunit YajC [Longimicrobiales bacterium]
MTEFLLMVPREGGNAATALFIQMAAFAAIFYFLLIRPQKKEQDRHKEMLAAIKKGDEIITGGGIVGKVVEAKDDRLTIQSGESKLVVERARVARRLGDDAGK